jgi:hypothetical protein
MRASTPRRVGCRAAIVVTFVAVVPALGCQVVAGIREREFRADESEGGTPVDDASDSDPTEPNPKDANTSDSDPSTVDAAPDDGGSSLLDADARVDAGPRVDARISDAADGGGQRVSTGTFLDVSAMGDRTCGVRSSDAEIECWGQSIMPSTPPRGPFSKVAVGGSHACGLATNGGAILCWGSNAFGQTNAPSGVFRAVTLGEAHSCGYRMDQTIVCWGDNQYHQTDLVQSSYAQLTAGGNRTCALGFDFVASCWGEGAGAQARPTPHFKTIATGQFESCGARTDRDAISCWNPAGAELAFERPGNFAPISVGPSQVCAVDVNASLSCWSVDNAVQVEVPPTGRFTEVTVGSRHACALRADSKVVCWGGNDKLQATPP